MKYLQEVNIREKTVFIRVDFNVPLDRNRNITDDTRIRAVLPTINYCLDEDAKVVLASHLGRPKGPDPMLSLAPVARRLGRLLHKTVKFVPDCIGPEVQKAMAEMQAGDVILLENLRFYPGEEKNDPEFARQLMTGVDVYVNDAFAVGHRAHASVHAVVQFAPVCVAGFLLRDEILYFHKSMEDPARPLVAIIGGAKISSKLIALRNLMKHVDKLIIGGAMANTFIKAKGYTVGQSLVEDSLLDTAKELMDTAIEKKVKFYLPVDCIVAEKLDSRADNKITPVQEVPDDWLIADIGPATITLFNEALQNAKTVVWNGPMGAFEIDAFSRGTMAMVHNVANSFALTIVGGGDTDVAIHAAGEANKISYISTGGGAFLELLEGKKLPGIQILEEWHAQHQEAG